MTARMTGSVDSGDLGGYGFGGPAQFRARVRSGVVTGAHYRTLYTHEVPDPVPDHVPVHPPPGTTRYPPVPTTVHGRGDRSARSA